jgi:bifunctional DNA-binding transcriptional regulator/antitoxin component of YhaV-PrlF toxin-antitoxin module
MNELESVTSKICSAREILDSAIDALGNNKKDKAETLMYAVDEYLQYYLEEFDRKFKDAWNETVTKLKQEEVDDYMRPWGHSDMEALSQYTDEEMDAMCDNAAKEDKVVRWQLPVEEDTVNGEYFITFPDDLLEAANLKEGDDVEWIDNDDGTFILKKSVKQLNHDEAIAAGWTMTADGFWVKE